HRTRQLLSQRTALLHTHHISARAGQPAHEPRILLGRRTQPIDIDSGNLDVLHTPKTRTPPTPTNPTPEPTPHPPPSPEAKSRNTPYVRFTEAASRRAPSLTSI